MSKNVKRALAEHFSSSKIEYYAVLSLADCRITKPYLLERLPFSPKSVIVFLAPYYCGERGNVSRYAASRDYHRFISAVGEGAADILSELLCARSAVFGDHSPIDERDAAAKGSLGILGENGLLINETYGSYVFIGEVITDAPCELVEAQAAARVELCEHCGRCMSACPKAEIGMCLSALTQKKGALSESERTAVKRYGMAWGCDICQEVCPHNREARVTPIEFFHTARIPDLSGAVITQMGDAEFSERAYSWRGRATVLRNLEILEDKGEI